MLIQHFVFRVILTINSDFVRKQHNGFGAFMEIDCVSCVVEINF